MAEKNGKIRKLNAKPKGQTRVPKEQPKAAESGREHYYYDFSLLFAVILVTVIGLLMVYSSSQYTALISHASPDYFARRQLVFAAVGVAAAVGVSLFNYRWIRPLVIPGYLFACGLLLLTMFVGRSSNGSTRWLSIGGFMFHRQSST